MTSSSINFFNFSEGIISFKESYNGCIYGSSFSFRSPGRKPKFSPASIAGLVNIILLTFLFFKALTANAIPVYVFPVPAGPMANTISLLVTLSIIFL